MAGAVATAASTVGTVVGIAVATALLPSALFERSHYYGWPGS